MFVLVDMDKSRLSSKWIKIFVNIYKCKILSKYEQSTHLIQIANLLSCFSNDLDCCKCARMRFHCTNGLVVLRDCAPQRGHCYHGSDGTPVRLRFSGTRDCCAKSGQTIFDFPATSFTHFHKKSSVRSKTHYLNELTMPIFW